VQGGDQDDLNEAILLHTQALELRMVPHPKKSISLHNLACALGTRFLQGGQQSDLDEAILLHRKALELQVADKSIQKPSFPRETPGFLSNYFRNLGYHKKLLIADD